MKFSKSEIDVIIAASPRTFIPFNKLHLSEDHQARRGGSTPKMTIEEVGALVGFLCSPGSSGMTGQTIYVDAGAHIVA